MFLSICVSMCEPILKAKMKMSGDDEVEITTNAMNVVDLWKFFIL